MGVPLVGAPGPRDVVATDLGVGSFGGSELSFAAGLVGADVVSVAYESDQRGRVEATVEAGHFALWFPGDELEAASHGVRVELMYADGSRGAADLRL